MTRVRGVFVAGDMGRGQSLIVRAIAEGRAAAAAVVISGWPVASRPHPAIGGEAAQSKATEIRSNIAA